MVNYRWLTLGLLLLLLALALFLIPWQALLTLLVLLAIIGGSLVNPIYQRLRDLDQQQPASSPTPQEDQPLEQTQAMYPHL